MGNPRSREEVTSPGSYFNRISKAKLFPTPRITKLSQKKSMSRKGGGIVIGLQPLKNKTQQKVKGWVGISGEKRKLPSLPLTITHPTIEMREDFVSSQGPSLK